MKEKSTRALAKVPIARRDISALVKEWERNVSLRQATALRRGWDVVISKKSAPANANAVATFEKQHAALPLQLKQLMCTVAAEWHFGWRCASNDEPPGKLASLYGGGIDSMLWSFAHLKAAQRNFAAWKKLRVDEANSPRAALR